MAAVSRKRHSECERQDLQVFATIFGQRAFEGRCIERRRGDDAQGVILATRLCDIKAYVHAGPI
jgi:hypothetical protein